MAEQIVRELVNGEWLTTFDTGGGGGGGGGSFQDGSVTLSAADLIALDSSPITIVPAPGSGMVILANTPGSGIYRGGSTPFTVTGSPAEILVVLEGAPQTPGMWGPGDLYFLNLGGTFDQTNDRFVSLTPDGNGAGAAFSADPAEWENRALQAVLITGATLADGDGTLGITIPYRVVDIS